MAQFLKNLLLKTLSRNLDNIAISIGNESLTYYQLFHPVLEFNKSLDFNMNNEEAMGVLADKSIVGFQCISSALLSGKSYVPLNIKYPVKRNASIIQQSGVKTLLVDSNCKTIALEIYIFLNKSIKLIILDRAEDGSITYISVLPENKTSTDIKLGLDIAYLLFTSGSTGTPKGVPISDKNIENYLYNISLNYDFSPKDRFSQFFDFTFDLSLHDILVCWKHGACLCPAKKQELLFPLHFAKKQSITVWFSVPSLAISAKDLMRKKFVDYRIENIKYSFFCGEALSNQLAKEWHTITNKSPVINLYGPTEATIAFTAFKYSQSSNFIDANVVPIGKAMGNNKCQVMKDDASICNIEEKGELCLSGKQVFDGYIEKNIKTKETFHYQKSSTGEIMKWYRTGDIVSIQKNGCLIYYGRNDRQVQVKGFRVELQEVEHVIRTILSTSRLAVIAYPINNIGEAKGLSLFISNNDNSSNIIDKCQNLLPHYMVPDNIIILKRFPFNSNGKLDYKKLIEIAKKQS